MKIILKPCYPIEHYSVMIQKYLNRRLSKCEIIEFVFQHLLGKKEQYFFEEKDELTLGRAILFLKKTSLQISVKMI